MSTELFMPPTYAKIPESSVFYVERIDNPARAARRENSRNTAKKRWAKPGAHDFVDESQAKALDVFDMDGHFVGSYPSSRKAAAALGLKNETNIRRCRRGEAKSYKGYIFRDHKDGATSISPYKRKAKKRGYTVNRRPGTFATRQVVSVCEFGILKEWDSIGACAAELGVTPGAIWIGVKLGRKVQGQKLEYKHEKRVLEKH